MSPGQPFARWRRLLGPAGLVLLAWALAGCTAAGGPTPRELTGTARAVEATGPTAAPLLLAVPESERATGEPEAGDTSRELGAAGASSPTVTLWVNETSAAHRVVLDEMSAEFEAREGLHLEVIQVAPELLPDLVQTAVLSDTLPDVILHPLEFSLGWVDQGILDPTAAAAVVTRLDPDTFAPTALALVDTPDGPAAVPGDGWAQLLIYRSDWLAAQGLGPPVNYDRLVAAAAAFFDPENLTSGLVVATESSLPATQRVFEWLARANGCELMDPAGQVRLLDEACQDALAYYRELINQYSPSDVQTDVSALKAYLAGRTAIISVPATRLRQLAGLDPTFPPLCPECGDPDYLVRQSGIQTTLRGRGTAAREASFAGLTYLGITRAAETDAAVAFVTYWLEEGYERWLQVDPERRVPLRWGTAADPGRFRDAWAGWSLTPGGPGMATLFGAETAAAIQAAVYAGDRWAFPQAQGAVMAPLYQNLTLSIVLQELLSGYFTSSYAIIEAHNRVARLIPDYAFEILPQPTATPPPRS